MNFAPRPDRCVYLDRFDAPRLKSACDRELAIATLKFHALFPASVPILSQSQVFDGLLPLLSGTSGAKSEEEFQAFVELVKMDNIALSLFGKSKLADALADAVSKGIDAAPSGYDDFFEFSGIPFLRTGTPKEMAEC